jgi:toxin HigB-1
MDVRFADDDLARAETDPAFGAGMTRDILKAFRKRLQFMRAAKDRRDLYASKGMRLEKLKGERKHEHSVRLNDQQRLILEFKDGENGEYVIIKGVEKDYH